MKEIAKNILTGLFLSLSLLAAMALVIYLFVSALNWDWAFIGKWSILISVSAAMLTGLHNMGKDFRDNLNK